MNQAIWRMQNDRRSQTELEKFQNDIIPQRKYAMTAT
jgi:hypothetical protein